MNQAISYLIILIVFLPLLNTGCGVTKNSNDDFCSEIKEDLRENLKYDEMKGVFYFDSSERMIKVESTIYFERHFDCFKGWNHNQLSKLLGKPNFYNTRYIRYYFMESCREVGEPCIYWEFILDTNRRVDCFRERWRNFPKQPE